MAICVSVLGPIAAALAGAVVGWALAMVTQHFQEVWFGPKLVIDCEKAPGNKTEDHESVWMKFRVQNKRKRRVAKNCRAYIIGLYRVSNNRIVSDNL